MRILLSATALATVFATSALADTTLKLVEVITSPQRTETLKSIVGQFEAANPGTTVEIISLPWGEAFQKFATMVSAGELPDVIEMPDTWLALYSNNGLLADLNPYLADCARTVRYTCTVTVNGDEMSYESTTHVDLLAHCVGFEHTDRNVLKRVE